jgi:hypothetical protein
MWTLGVLLSSRFCILPVTLRFRMATNSNQVNCCALAFQSLLDLFAVKQRPQPTQKS